MAISRPMLLFSRRRRPPLPRPTSIRAQGFRPASMRSYVSDNRPSFEAPRPCRPYRGVPWCPVAPSPVILSPRASPPLHAAPLHSYRQLNRSPNTARGYPELSLQLHATRPRSSPRQPLPSVSEPFTPPQYSPTSEDAACCARTIGPGPGRSTTCVHASLATPFCDNKRALETRSYSTYSR